MSNNVACHPTGRVARRYEDRVWIIFRHRLDAEDKNNLWISMMEGEFDMLAEARTLNHRGGSSSWSARLGSATGLEVGEVPPQSGRQRGQTGYARSARQYGENVGQ